MADDANPSITFQCYRCKEHFTSISAVRKHLTDCSDRLLDELIARRVEWNKYKPTNNLGFVECKFCHRLFPAKRLATHVKTKHAMCRICGRRGKRARLTKSMECKAHKKEIDQYTAGLMNTLCLNWTFNTGIYSVADEKNEQIYFVKLNQIMNFEDSSKLQSNWIDWN